MTGDEHQSGAGIATVKRQLVQPTIRSVLALVLLFVARFVLARVPGVDIVLIGPDITIATILFSLLTIGMFYVIVDFAGTAAETLESAFETVPAVGDIVTAIGYLVVVLWASQIFWWLPVLRNNRGLYDLIFLVASLALLGWIGYRLYENLDAYAGAVTAEVSERESFSAAVPTGSVEGSASPESEPATHEGSGGMKAEPGAGHAEPTETAPATEHPPDQSTADAAEPDETDEPAVESNDDASGEVYCQECGAALPAEASFCSSCGAEVPDHVGAEGGR